MKGLTLLLIALVLFALALGVPRVLPPSSPAAVSIALLRVPAVICAILGLIRFSRESRARKS